MKIFFVILAGFLLGISAWGGEVANPIVFIHGFKGSQLFDENNQVRWVTVLQSLGFNSAIDLPAEWTADGEQSRDLLRSGEVLKNVFVIPYLVGEKVYGPWLVKAQEFAKKSKRPFYAYAYDWRRDNNETSIHFEAFLDKIRNNSKVDLVAHSMGGLISLSVLNRRKDIIRKLVFAGVPFQGGTGFLEDMHVGKATGLNKKILSPEVLFTFPSVYSLFSEEGRGLVDENGHDLYVDFYSARSWVEYKLGVFSMPGRDRNKDEIFLRKALAAAKEFRQGTHVPPALFPPLLILLGSRTPTLRVAQKDGPKAIRGWDFSSTPRTSGDGRVADDNLPPAGTNYKLVHTEYEHSDLLSDPKAVDEIFNFLEGP